MSNTAKSIAGGLTPSERKKLLEELEALERNPQEVIQDRKLTPRERVVGTFLRERDHLDGCPVYDADGALVAKSVEAWDTPAAAPAKGLREAGVRPGDTVTVVRCHRCGGSRVFPGSVSDAIRKALDAEPDEDPDRSA